MKIIEPSFEILDCVNSDAILHNIELYGRVCYKSEKCITPDSAAQFIRSIIDYFTFKIPAIHEFDTSDIAVGYC